METTKQVSRKELLQLAFFKLLKTKKEDAALCLSTKLMTENSCQKGEIYFADSSQELEIIETLDCILEGKRFVDLCDIFHTGIYVYRIEGIEGADVIINTKRYEEYK